MREHWDEKKTMAENFKEMGLSLNMAPRMQQSKEGQKILSAAYEAKYPGYMPPKKRHDFAESDEEEEPAEPKDLCKLFPKIRSVEDSIIVKTPSKLKADEVTICEKLIKKFGENTHKMAKDTKLNYLQWSRAQTEKAIATYKEHYVNKQV